MITGTQITATTAQLGAIGPAAEMALLFGEIGGTVERNVSLTTGEVDMRGLVTDARRLADIVRGASRNDVERMNAVLAPSASQVASMGRTLAHVRDQASDGYSQRILGEFMYGADESVRLLMEEATVRRIVSPLVSQMQHLTPNALLALYRDRSHYDKGVREEIEVAVQSSSDRWLRFRAVLHDLWKKVKG